MADLTADAFPAVLASIDFADIPGFATDDHAAALQAFAAGAAVLGSAPPKNRASGIDAAALAPLVLRHRLIGSFQAEAEGLTADDIIGKLLHDVREG